MDDRKIHLPFDEIVRRLQPHVTEERFARIQDVVKNRIPNASVILENIYDRGNISAVMRSAEAFGLHQLNIIELSEKFKESKRVTQGAHKWIESRKWSATVQCIEHLKAQGQKIYVTHLDDQATSIDNVDFSVPFAIAFGNEKDGASAELLEMADTRVFIPMQGFVQSFNISVAAALCFYHIRKFGNTPQLTQAQSDELTAKYLIQSIEHWYKYLEN